MLTAVCKFRNKSGLASTTRVMSFFLSTFPATAPTTATPLCPPPSPYPSPHFRLPSPPRCGLAFLDAAASARTLSPTPRQAMASLAAAAAVEVTHLSQRDAMDIDEQLMGPLSFSVDQLMELAELSVATAVAKKLIAEAAGYGSQLVLFPEAFVGGYPHGFTFGLTIGSRSAKGKEDFRKYHAAAIDVSGPEVSRLAALAGKYKVFLVMGVVERAGYTLYNTVPSFDSLGKYLGKHRKLMPTAMERVFWGFGDGSTIPVYDTPLGKIGAAICWENRMPLIRTAMYAKGVEIYCAPTADALPSWQSSMKHIALEGGCFVLTANQFYHRKDFPPPPEYTFGGHEEEPSPKTIVCPGGISIISPSGTVLAGPNYESKAFQKKNYESEALLTADLDLGEIVRTKFDLDVVGRYTRPEALNLNVMIEPKHAVSFASTVG